MELRKKKLHKNYKYYCMMHARKNEKKKTLSMKQKSDDGN